MSKLLSGIGIPNQEYKFVDSENKRKDIIEDLSKINIFIGRNNSGKSRLLRSLLSTTSLEFVLENVSLENLNENIESLKKEIQTYQNNHKIKVDNVHNIIGEMEQVRKLNETSELGNALAELRKNVNNMLAQNNKSWSNGLTYPEVGKEFKKIFENYMSEYSEEFDELKTNFQRVYVPILRGLRPVNYENGKFTEVDNYKLRTLNDYFESEKERQFKIYSGLDIYSKIRSHLLGSLEERKSIRKFQDFLGDRFFDGKNVTLIPSESPDILTVKIGKEMEQPIFNLGDGIQAILSTVLPLFLDKEKSLLVFIEEPEQYLHPGLQRKLIDSLVSEKEFENHQFFFTTHSNHFLDLTLDYSKISIFGLEKKFKEQRGDERKPEFEIYNYSKGDNSSLELLGVRNSSVFLSNCTIWVEGITDRLYLRHYLKLYFDKIKSENEEVLEEDNHYSFVEYSGNNITHWSFLDDGNPSTDVERLCGKIFLIADRDEDKEERHAELEESLGKRFHKLKSREIENTITKEVLLRVIEEYEGETPKIEDFSEEDYKDEPLGNFIEEKLEEKKRAGSYSLASGTISDKVNFCKKVISHTTTWDDLSDESKDLVKKIYNFIKENT